MSVAYGPLTSDRFTYELSIEKRFEALRNFTSTQLKDWAQDYSPHYPPTETYRGQHTNALKCLVEILAGRLGQEIALSGVKQDAIDQMHRDLESLNDLADACEEDDEASPASQELYQAARQRIGRDTATEALEAMTPGDVALSEAAKGARL